MARWSLDGFKILTRRYRTPSKLAKIFQVPRQRAGSAGSVRVLLFMCSGSVIRYSRTGGLSRIWLKILLALSPHSPQLFYSITTTICKVLQVFCHPHLVNAARLCVAMCWKQTATKDTPLAIAG